MEIQKTTERPALSAILIIIGLVLIGMVIGNILAAVEIIKVGGIDFKDLDNMNQAFVALSESPNGWLSLVLAQGCVALITFIGAGLFYWNIIEKRRFSDLNFKPLPQVYIFLYVILIEIVLLPFNSWIQAINEKMNLPSFMKSIEDAIRAKEDELAEMTKYLTNFNSIGELIIAIIVIAVIAGIGEELIFRGLIQRKLLLGLKNIHLAIWGAAFIFSFIHFQFYGFLPRLFLGALFGYFYYWTGNLWIPIAAHIFNNAFAVIMMYLIHLKKVSPEIEKMDTLPLPYILLSVVFGAGMLLYFNKLTEKES